MIVTKKHFSDYGNCSESQPFIDFLFGDKQEMDSDELVRLAIAAVGEPPLNITKEKLQHYLFDPQHFICDSDLIRQFLNVENSEMVRYSKNIKDSKFIFNSDGLENCHYCYDSRDSKNMIFSSKSDSTDYMIAGRAATQAEFESVVKGIADARARLKKNFNIFEALRDLNIEVCAADVLNEDAREFFSGQCVTPAHRQRQRRRLQEDKGDG